MKQRKAYLDHLRILAALSVVITHVLSEFWYRADIRSLEWNVMNIFETALRWNVAIFIMVSGSLFLSKDVPTKTIYRKYIPRMAVSYVVWSLLYATLDPYFKTGTLDLSLTTVIKRTIEGGYHMWFVPMIIGLYMCLPIFREIVKSEKVTKYFLGLSFLFTFLIPQMALISNDIIGGSIAEGFKNIKNFVSYKMSMSTVLGFSFYFILGYYINTVEITKKQRRIIYSLGILGFLATVLLTAIVSMKNGSGSAQYYDHFNIGILSEAVALHTLIRYRKHSNEKRNAIARYLGKYSFGVYLVHVFLMNILLFKLRMPALFGSPLISIPIISLTVILLSFGVIWLIHRIPILKKWIV